MENELVWTDGEIVRSYQEAKDQSKQIHVLADLNACKPAVIRDILKRNGQRMPAKPHEPKSKKKKRMQTERSKAGFGGGKSILLEKDGRMYSIKEVAQIHGRTSNCVREHCIGTDVCMMYGVEYIVHRYQKPMRVEGE